MELARGLRKILRPRPRVGVQEEEHEGGTMKRSRTPNPAVWGVPQESSWDREPLIRIPECRAAPTLSSALKVAPRGANPDSRTDGSRTRLCLSAWGGKERRSVAALPSQLKKEPVPGHPAQIE